MNDNQLECFVNLSYTLNFTQTAENLHMTQSAVSRSIISLENELGIKLLERNKREVRLTDAGLTFRHDACDLLERSQLAIERAKQSLRKPSENLHIGFTNTTLEKKFFPELISKYHEIYPDVNIHLEEGTYNSIRNNLLNNRYDCAFLSEDGMVHMPDYNFYKLLAGKLIAIIPNHNHLSEKIRIGINDLDGENILFLNHRQIPYILNNLQKEIRSKLPNSNFYYSDTVGVSMILADSQLGIAIIPSILMSNENNENSRIVPFQEETDMYYGIAAKKDAPIKVTRLVELAQSILI